MPPPPPPTLASDGNTAAAAFFLASIANATAAAASCSLIDLSNMRLCFLSLPRKGLKTVVLTNLATRTIDGTISTPYALTPEKTLAAKTTLPSPQPISKKVSRERPG